MTKRYIILGVNENVRYLYYLPLVIWAWQRLGWEVVTFYCGKMEVMAKFIPDYKKYVIRECLVYEKYNSATIAQVARLYGACVIYNGLLMTSDVDMLPLSDYWKPECEKITVYGRDLTDYHYPICYIAMSNLDWITIMQLEGPLYGVHLRRDLRVQENMWGLDQDIITENLLKNANGNIVRVDRGTDKRTGYPIGRVDRSHWTLDHKQFIDAHLPHDSLTNTTSFHKVLQLLHTVWPKENWKWWLEYTKEFKKHL